MESGDKGKRIIIHNFNLLGGNVTLLFTGKLKLLIPASGTFKWYLYNSLVNLNKFTNQNPDYLGTPVFQKD